MNDFRYCKRCNSLFKYQGWDMCPACLKKYDEIMDKIKNFTFEYPSSGVVEIANGIDEKEKDILYLLRTGRLSIKAVSEVLICSNCGKRIEKGKYCGECTGAIQEKFKKAECALKKNVKNENSEAPSGKIYTFYRHI